MNKEEILAKSRNENKGVDELEASVLAAAGRVASQVGIIICCLTAVLQVIFTDRISFESWMIYFSILAAQFIVKYIKLRQKHELVMAALNSALFVFFTVLYVVRLAG